MRLLIKIVRSQNDRAISEFYLLQVFYGGDILMKILKNFKTFEKMKIEKEIMRRKDVKRRRGCACSTSYPSGNEVDGLPLVAIPKQ